MRTVSWRPRSRAEGSAACRRHAVATPSPQPGDDRPTRCARCSHEPHQEPKHEGVTRHSAVDPASPAGVVCERRDGSFEIVLRAPGHGQPSETERGPGITCLNAAAEEALGRWAARTGR